MASADAIIQPWFGGARSLDEQMLGLAPALEEARGKSVADFGCAEGHISLEFAKAGAASVFACDYNAGMIGVANAELANAGVLPVEFRCLNIEDMIQSESRPEYDIVLALAVLHKLSDPAAGARFCADSARDLIVVRLPSGSTGRVRGKHSGIEADIPFILSGCGFKRERKEAGPRGELIHFYRRVSAC